jgi:DNA ligase (NAD+)
VSSGLTYLVNNDNTSTSGKNKKAQELGIPVITEDEFLTMVGK